MQVRLTHQFEEGLTIGVHLVSAPKKAKLSPGGYRWGRPFHHGHGELVSRIHLQNARFSLTTGVPPTLVHSWEMVDLRWLVDMMIMMVNMMIMMVNMMIMIVTKMLMLMRKTVIEYVKICQLQSILHSVIDEQVQGHHSFDIWCNERECLQWDWVLGPYYLKR